MFAISLKKTWVDTSQFFILGIVLFSQFISILLLITIFFANNTDNLLLLPFYILSFYVLFDNIVLGIRFRGGKRMVNYYSSKSILFLKNNGILAQLTRYYKSVTEEKYYGPMKMFFKTYYYTMENNPEKKILFLLVGRQVIIFISSKCIDDITKIEKILNEFK